MILKAKTACGDDANSPPNTGLCSKKSVFQCVLTPLQHENKANRLSAGQRH